MKAPLNLLLPLALAAILSAADGDSVLIRNVTVHPIMAPDIANSSVLIVDGKIAAVGPKLALPKGVRAVEGKGLQLYPGLMNAATNVGLAEIEALRDTVDLDEIGAFNPELRAEVAFNPSSEHIEVTRAAGITSVLTLPGSGQRGGRGGDSFITGQGAIMRLDGWTWEEMAVRRGAVMDLVFPRIQAAQTAGPPPATPPSFQEQEKQYKEKLREISQFFERARQYRQARLVNNPDFHPDLRLEAMIPVLEGKQPVFVRAERERAIKDAVEFADKEKIKIVIAGPRELGTIGPALKERHIPVILGKTFLLPLNDDDPYDAPYTLPAEFFRAGVKFCFGTFDVEFARNVPLEAAQAVAFGLPHDEALKALTINSAEILGAGGELGSIEKGKWGDLILTDGDPMEAKTTVKAMFIKGREVKLESRHTREFEKWMKR